MTTKKKLSESTPASQPWASWIGRIQLQPDSAPAQDDPAGGIHFMPEDYIAPTIKRGRGKPVGTGVNVFALALAVDIYVAARAGGSTDRKAKESAVAACRERYPEAKMSESTIVRVLVPHRRHGLLITATGPTSGAVIVAREPDYPDLRAKARKKLPRMDVQKKA